MVKILGKVPRKFGENTMKLLKKGKLAVSKSTVRTLTDGDLQQVAGGDMSGGSCGCTFSCSCAGCGSNGCTVGCANNFINYI